MTDLWRSHINYPFTIWRVIMYGNALKDEQGIDNTNHGAARSCHVTTNYL